MTCGSENEPVMKSYTSVCGLDRSGTTFYGVENQIKELQKDLNRNADNQLYR